nr:dephospho-CoA kinase [uncultured Ottowia sp.]
MFRLGLTGGIGSGKTTVAQMLAARGAAVIDADAISRALTASHGAALPAIATQFGTHVIGPDGALNRSAMRQMIFADPAARQRLEAILHPLVEQALEEQTREAAMRSVRCVVFDIPLLIENFARWQSRIDALLVVDCPEDVQITRVMARSQLSREEVMHILSAQASRAQRLAMANFVITNDAGTTLQALEKQLEALLPRFGL